MSVRQLIPEDLAGIAPGPELARVLAGLELSRLSGFDCVEVLKAQYRQANHERARVMAVMAEVGVCGLVPEGDLTRRVLPDEFSADEVRAALVLTRRAAHGQCWLAHDLVTRLPQVHAAMDAGVLDEPRARVFSEWTIELSPEQARAVCAALLPRAPKLTTGQLIEQIKKMAIAIDPDWAQRRYEQALADRKVVGYRNPDGSANLSGCNLPVDRVAAASGHIDALAKAAKRAGDSRPIDHIRADLFLGMTDGTYTGLDDTAIINLLTATPSPEADQPHNDSDKDRDDNGPDTEGPDGSRPDGGEQAAEGGGEEPTTHQSAEVRPADAEPADAEPDAEAAGGSEVSGEEVGECRAPASDTSPARVTRAMVGAGVELRVRLSTLLGLDQYPAELAGWGPLHAGLARDLAISLGGAQWRFAITDDHGQLTHCGLTPARPFGTLTRSTACRALVELQVPATVLRALAADSTAPANWADVITDLARQLNHNSPSHDQYRGDATRRAPGAMLRRYLEIRDRYCTMIGCRAPAHTADKDHTHDHTKGGPTIGSNLGDACRHDHRLKGEGGWALQQSQPGVFRWTSRLGHSYERRPPAIIEPLPDPIPRDRSPFPLTIPLDDDWEDTQIWDDPESEPEPDPPPEPDPRTDIPPF
ncbi:MAG TPA: DUF222 domain-containing protein [Pseudonocardiaceae bacterium]|nr:DUF222 domain-containing protein [Pseudonocardiaceae bacterium]